MGVLIRSPAAKGAALSTARPFQQQLARKGRPDSTAGERGTKQHAQRQARDDGVLVWKRGVDWSLLLRPLHHTLGHITCGQRVAQPGVLLSSGHPTMTKGAYTSRGNDFKASVVHVGPASWRRVTSVGHSQQKQTQAQAFWPTAGCCRYRTALPLFRP